MSHRTLTDADLEAIREYLHAHDCKFHDDEIQFVRDFMGLYRETRSTLLKGFLGCLAMFIFILAILAYNHGMIKVK